MSFTADERRITPGANMTPVVRPILAVIRHGPELALFAAMKRPALIAAVLGIAACSTTTTAREKLPPLKSVASVDLQRYLGTWYEIQSFPQSFQKDCFATTATYSL